MDNKFFNWLKNLTGVDEVRFGCALNEVVLIFSKRYKICSHNLFNYYSHDWYSSEEDYLPKENYYISERYLLVKPSTLNGYTEKQVFDEKYMTNFNLNEFLSKYGGKTYMVDLFVKSMEVYFPKDEIEFEILNCIGNNDGND
jgi:hypothetical protein